MIKKNKVNKIDFVSSPLLAFNNRLTGIEIDNIEIKSMKILSAVQAVSLKKVLSFKLLWLKS